ncbi:putative peptidase family-domain-containing protein [Boeremia exigua]|uniref:putative peptidase family-domain-containing protein n=1 Tax=Boeremia exigua TaxID=749465 RepID=UPI001E8EC1CF|nr:putative peptidase family-domain-containing protein [Boeremia exigua]KAH6644301.1 putative peptidase family-domain-containing protein [Boeremia exigua]
MTRLISLIVLAAATVSASPLAVRHTAPAEAAPTSTAWNAGAVTQYPIHASCNATQHQYIRNGLDETLTICRQARDHILRWGNSSAIYQKYFGNAPTGEPIGWFTKIVDGDKSDVLFRCDDPDQNCATQSNWAGHWRGVNASSETVICDRSYELRRPLEGMCMFGYDVANGATNFYWGSDLLHRLLHIPSVGEGIVEHYGGADEYPGVLALAESNPTEAVRNSDTLQYFALEVYAHDVAVPGIGCAGHYREVSSTTAPAASASSASASASSTVASSAVAASVTSAAVSATSAAASAAASCTPHDDHWHCPAGVPEPTSPPP